jgi:hypothetical protein
MIMSSAQHLDLDLEKSKYSIFQELTTHLKTLESLL